MQRYLILGAGGVGCALGGMLQLAGADVTFVARGAQLDALQRQGLALRTPEATHSMSVRASARPDDGDRSRVVLLCVKSQDTAPALQQLARWSVDTPIVCAQNGVTNETHAATRFESVYGMMVWCYAAFVEPGVASIYSAPLLGALDVGMHPGGVDDIARSIAEDLCVAGFDARPHERILEMKRAKLLLNLGGTVQALFGSSIRARDVAKILTNEGRACMLAAQHDFIEPNELLDRCRHIEHRPIDGQLRPGGSMWQSLARSKPLETAYLNGEIVRLGQAHGVPTPANTALVASAKRATSARPESLDIHDLTWAGSS